RDGGLGAIAGERLEALSLAAGHDHAEAARASGNVRSCLRRLRPRGVERREDEVLALEAAQHLARLRAEDVAVLEGARHLGEALELRVVLGHATLGVI